RVGVRHETREHAARPKARLRRLQGGAHLRRVMRIVVDHGDPVDLATYLEPTGRSPKASDGVDGGGHRHPQADARGQRRQPRRCGSGNTSGWSQSMLVSTASWGAKWMNLGRGSKAAEVYSSPSKTNSRPVPQAAAAPRSGEDIPSRNPGLRRADRRIHAIRLAVVVFPCEPHTTIRNRSLVSSPQNSASLTIRSCSFLAASFSGLPSRTLLACTTRSG